MNRLAQEAVVVGLAKRLADRGSWTGETHLQKAAYLLSELRGVEFDFDFILYKHGPFSFELRDELAAMQAEGLLHSYSPNPRYGPQLLVTPRGERLEQSFAKTMHRYGPSLDWIAGELRQPRRHGPRAPGDGNVDDPRVPRRLGRRSCRPDRVKPHISTDDAELAVEEVDRLLAESAAIRS